MKRFALALLTLAALVSAAAAAPTPPPPEPVTAVRTDQVIVIDGILDEPVWQNDQATTAFYQRDPDPGAPGHQKSEVRFAYDDDALYVGARLYDTAPDSVIARLARRDVVISSDRISIYLDPFHDKRTGYYFMVNAAGTMYDGTLSNDGWEDDSWDGVWQAKVHRDAKGWTAEMRIPFSQLRFRATEHMVWGVNIRRVLPRYNEEDFLIYPPRGISGFVSFWPELRGLDGVHSGRHLEVTPYVTGKSDYAVHDPSDPFHSGSQNTPAGGADLRTSLGNNLTLNATINPDFGQVEIDPAVVNLSDVETYFQEKRPFFTEGNAVFHTGNNGAGDYWNFNWPDPTFFYSRRIGRAPQRDLSGFDFADVTNGTHILGAAKITGQLAQSWNVGTVQAVTEREFADVSLAGQRSHLEAEPLTYYGVFRGMHEMSGGLHGLGIMTTVVGRDLNDPGLADQLDRSGLMTALDGWTFLDHDKTWVVSGWAAGSNVTGTPARITALEQDSQHYFQRPDAGYLHLDSTATSLSGYGARLWLNKQTGSILSNSALGLISPGFENNDLGFLSRADLINGHVGLGWQWNKSNSWRRYANVISALFSSWTMDGTNTQTGGYLGFSLTTQANMNANANVIYDPQGLSARATRGGPFMLSPGSTNYNGHVDTDDKRPFVYSIDGSFSRDQSGGFEWNVSPAVTWKPVSNLSVQVGPNYDHTVSTAQYVTTAADPLATATFGQDYVFAHLDQHTVGASIRADLSLTPTLTFQLYAQPLISTGLYTDYGSLAAPRTHRFNPYDAVANGVNDNFNYHTIRGNSVLRWEYHPGSTLFLVWTQDRTATDPDGEFHLSTSISEIARTKANDVFLIKVAHHFDL